MSALLEVPADLAAVQDSLAEAMSRVEHVFDDALRSDLPPVERLCKHVERYRGKMLRPALVILSHAAAPGATIIPADVPESVLRLAAVCEMIHMATLVHDDVLDEADTRRKGATVNRLHGNEAAVILGDYLFSAAYRLCSSIGGPAGQHASLMVATTGMTLCAGELLQLHHRENLSLDEDTYFEIVRRKTASLIATACRLGAAANLPGIDPATSNPAADPFHTFGLNLGVAFQIQDDILDLTGTETTVGKPVRKDIEMGKLTLPLIHHLAAASPLRRGRTLDLLVAGGAGAPQALLSALEETDSIHHARQTARRLVDEAKSALAHVPDSPPKRFMLLMADAVITRSF
ncbi:MAG: polyprenyl synthetase family protein [Phycisphaeraceae bacterium]|nr:polyprenyl synthetase family protein [Phycisphaeraceae bacterium]